MYKAIHTHPDFDWASLQATLAKGTERHCSDARLGHGYLCTRAKGHVGDHVAHGGCAVATWSNHEDVPDNSVVVNLRVINRYAAKRETATPRGQGVSVARGA